MELEIKMGCEFRKKEMVNLLDVVKKLRKRRREKCLLDFVIWRLLMFLIIFFSGSMKGKGRL